MSDGFGWWAVVVRIAGVIETEGPASIEEYSLRLVQACSLAQAKTKALRYAQKTNSDTKTADGKTISHLAYSVIGAEVLGENAPSDGDEIWSRLAFLERKEDRSFQGKSPPSWALRAFHTDWNIKGFEERR